MVTSAPRRRAATLLSAASIAVLCSAGAAWADEPTPTPAADAAAPADAQPSPAEAPEVQPSVGTWIVGGTLLEGTQSKPAAKPIAKPVAKPASKPVTRHHRSTVVRPATTAGGATALPFTGPGHVDLLLPIGLLLVSAGVGMTVAGRARPATA